MIIIIMCIYIILLRIYNSVRELRKNASLCSIVISLDRQLSILPRSVTFGRELPQVDSTWTHGAAESNHKRQERHLLITGNLNTRKGREAYQTYQNFESSIAADRKSSLRNTTATALHPPKPGQKNMEKPQPPYLV